MIPSVQLTPTGRAVWTAVAALLALTAFPASSRSAETSLEGMVKTINREFQTHWKSREMAPQACSDATFLRRITLDLTGRLPSVAEIRQFTASDDPDRRRRVVDRLSRGAAFCNRSARLLRMRWFPQTAVEPYQYLAGDTELWIATQLRAGRPLNRIAGDLVAVPYTTAPRQSNGPALPRTLIEANDHSPAQMAGNAASGFLGVDLSCARCHDHPSQRWTQVQFWQTAAFFTTRTNDSAGGDSIEIPGANRRVNAALFTGGQLPGGTEKENGRDLFARWMTTTGNPYFAKQAVNQTWADLCGAPLVDSVTSTNREETPLSSLLDQLASAFARSGFDYPQLVRAIVLSKPYQLPSTRAEPASAKSPQVALAPVRALDGEQIFDSLRLSAGLPLTSEGFDGRELAQQRQEFIRQFQVEGDARRGVTQALTLMNGDITRQLTTANGNATIAAMAAAPFMTEQACMETLFLATLGRPPQSQERTGLRKAGLWRDDASSRARRYGAVFWLLINTIEFNTNH